MKQNLEETERRNIEMKRKDKPSRKNPKGRKTNKEHHSNGNKHSTEINMENKTPVTIIKREEIISVEVTRQMIEKWTIDEVLKWVKDLNLEQETSNLLSEIVVQEEISGNALLLMTTADWKSIGITKMGPLKILENAVLIKHQSNRVKY